MNTVAPVDLTHTRCVVVATLDWLRQSIKCGAAAFEAVGIGPHGRLVPARGLDTGERTLIRRFPQFVPAVHQMGVLNAVAMRALGNVQVALSLLKKLFETGSASHVL